MKFPLIVTNFKNYPSAVGENANKLVRAHLAAQTESGYSFAVAVSPLDLRAICAEFAEEILIFAQHVDAAEYGSTTGKIVPEEVKKMGAFGTLLNHSENRVANREALGQMIRAAKNAELFVIVCAENDDEGAEIMEAFAPDMIAVEPPELIGGNISVSTADPDLIKRSVEKIGNGKCLVGAGVKNGTDVKTAIEFGAVGVLLASGVTKADDPKAVLLDLVSEV